MIKSSDKENNNTYRILKVLSNKDYLAIDLHMAYYILSPIHQKHTQPKTFINHRQIKPLKDISNHIIQPKQAIQIDNLVYSVFYVGKQEPIWVKNIQHSRIINYSFLYTLFQHIIRNILKYLLYFRLQDIKLCLDSRNFILIKGQIYLLLLPRTSNKSNSLKRSQRNTSKSPQKQKQGSLNSILNNELAIIKEIGMLMIGMFGLNNFTQSELRQNESIWNDLKFMIKGEVTYEYLQIKLNETKINKRNSPFKMITKIQKIISKSKTPESYRRLRSIDVDKNIQMETQPFPYVQKTPRNFENTSNFKKRVLTTQTRYSQQKKYYQSFSQKSKLVHLSGNDQIVVPKGSHIWKNRIQRNNREKNRYKEWLNNHKFELKFKERIERQGEIAREKFRKSVEKDDESNSSIVPDDNNLKIKLMKKIKRFKTDFDSANIKDLPIVSISKEILQQNIEYSDKFSVKRKLNFDEIELKPKQQKYLKILKQENQQKSSLINNPMEDSIKKYITQSQANQIKQPLNKANIIVQNPQVKQSSFEIISSSLQVQGLVKNVQQKIMIDDAYQDQQQIVKAVQINEIINFEKIQELTQQKCSQQSPSKPTIKNQLKMKKKHIIQTDVELDEIQEITLIQKNKNNNISIKKEANNNYLTHTEPKEQGQSQQKSIQGNTIQLDTITKYFEQYLTLINILGNVCVKAVRSRTIFQGIQWRKGIYFIYQRFCYQRLKISRCLEHNTNNIFRKNRKINNSSLINWSKSNIKFNKLQKIHNENIRIYQDLNKFSEKVSQSSKLDRKRDYYLRHRDKFINTDQTNQRFTLSKLAISSFIEMYDFIVQKRINKKQVIQMVLDCLFGLRIIAQLDGVIEENKWININDYQKYSYNLQGITGLMEELYFKYYDNQQIKQ